MIPEKILNLIDLALRDGVLTIREKETIIAEAMALGVAKDEITALIDSRVEKLIGSMPKENLKKCPSCGAQIPLISDDCLYCGHRLTQGKGARPIGTGNLSQAERIIMEENAQTNSQNINIKICPDCGAPYPILSNICPQCGHVLHEYVDSEFNIKNLIDNAQTQISKLKECKVSVFAAMIHSSWIYAAELSFLFFIICFMSGNTKTAPLCGILLLYAWVVYFRNVFKGKSPVAMADKKYFEIKSEYEKLRRHTDAIYGNNAEADAVIRQLEDRVAGIDEQNRKNRKVVRYINIGAIALIAIVYFAMASEKNLYESKLESNAKMFELSGKEKVIRHGIYASDGKFHNTYSEMQNWEPYLKVADKAVLKVVPKGSSGITMCNDSLYTMKVQNLRLESTGKRYPGNADSLNLLMLIFDKNGKKVAGFKSALVDETFKNDSIHHQMPDSSRLDFKRLMREGRYSYYINFENIKPYDTCMVDSLIMLMDKAESFVLFTNK